MSLRNSAFSSIRWTASAAVLRAGLQFLQVVVLARLLTPSDFGLMAMAGAVTSFATPLLDFGLGSALMHFPRPDKRALSTIYWLNLGLACSLALAFFLLAWPIAHIYRQAELLPVLLWLSIIFPLNAIGHIFRVLAEKELRFSVLAQQEVVATFAGFVVAVVLALRGGGAYALVAAALASAAMSSVLAWIRLSAGVRPSFEFSFQKAKPFLKFGMHRMGDGVWNNLRMQADIFIAGVYATPAAVALYATPRDLCLRIANAVVNPVVTRISLPVMTKLQGDITLLREVYLKTLRLVSSLNFPLYTLLALFPGDVIAFVLGSQWGEAAPYLRLLAIWALIRSTGNPSGSLLYAVGMARRSHLWNLTLFLSVVPLLWGAMILGGGLALAWTMLVVQVVTFVLAWRFLIRPACGAGLQEYLASLMPPFCATLLSAALAFMAAYFQPPPWRLFIGTGVMGVAYLVFSWWFNRSWISAVTELLRPALRRLR